MVSSLYSDTNSFEYTVQYPLQENKIRAGEFVVIICTTAVINTCLVLSVKTGGPLITAGNCYSPWNQAGIPCQRLEL